MAAEFAFDFQLEMPPQSREFQKLSKLKILWKTPGADTDPHTDCPNRINQITLMKCVPKTSSELTHLKATLAQCFFRFH